MGEKEDYRSRAGCIVTLYHLQSGTSCKHTRRLEAVSLLLQNHSTVDSNVLLGIGWEHSELVQQQRVSLPPANILFPSEGRSFKFRSLQFDFPLQKCASIITENFSPCPAARKKGFIRGKTSRQKSARSSQVYGHVLHDHALALGSFSIKMDNTFMTTWRV